MNTKGEFRKCRARLQSSEEQVSNLKEVLKRSKGLIVKLMHEQASERESKLQNFKDSNVPCSSGEENNNLSNLPQELSLSSLQETVSAFSSLISERNEAHRHQLQRLNDSTIRGLNCSRAQVFRCKMSVLLDTRTYRQSALKLSFMRLQAHAGLKRIEKARRQYKLREVLRRKELETKRKTLSQITEDGYAKAIRELHEAQQKLHSSHEIAQTIVRQRLRVLNKKAEKQAMTVAFARLLRHSRVYTHNERQQNFVRLYSLSAEYILKTQQHQLTIILKRRALSRWGKHTERLQHRQDVMDRLLHKHASRQERLGFAAIRRFAMLRLAHIRNKQCAALSLLEAQCKKIKFMHLWDLRCRSFVLWKRKLRARSKLKRVLGNYGTRTTRLCWGEWKHEYKLRKVQCSKLKSVVVMTERRMIQRWFSHLAMNCKLKGTKLVSAKLLLCRLSNLDSQNRLRKGLVVWHRSVIMRKHSDELRDKQQCYQQNLNDAFNEKDNLKKLAREYLLKQQNEMQTMNLQFTQKLNTTKVELLWRSVLVKFSKLALRSSLHTWKAIHKRDTLLARCIVRLAYRAQAIALVKWKDRLLKRKEIQKRLQLLIRRKDESQQQLDQTSVITLLKRVYKKWLGAKGMHTSIKRMCRRR